MGPIEVFLLGVEDFHDTGRSVDWLIASREAGTIRVVDARLSLVVSLVAGTTASWSRADHGRPDAVRRW